MKSDLEKDPTDQDLVLQEMLDLEDLLRMLQIKIDLLICSTGTLKEMIHLVDPTLNQFQIKDFLKEVHCKLSRHLIQLHKIHLELIKE